jgi:hypothetical protein
MKSAAALGEPNMTANSSAHVGLDHSLDAQ